MSEEQVAGIHAADPQPEANGLEQWLAGSAATMHAPPGTPAGLFERLRAVNDILREAGGRADTSRLLYRQDGRVQVLELGDVTLVGRETLSAADSRLSRRHFQVSRTTDGTHVEDLASSNGTFVNGERTDSAWLKEGDLIEAGGIAFVFVGGPDELSDDTT